MAKNSTLTVTSLHVLAYLDIHGASHGAELRIFMDLPATTIASATRRLLDFKMIDCTKRQTACLYSMTTYGMEYLDRVRKSLTGSADDLKIPLAKDGLQCK